MDIISNDFVIVFSESLNSTDVQYKELESLLRLSKYKLMDVRDQQINRIINNKNDLPTSDVVYRGSFKQSCILRTTAEIDLLHEIMERSSYIQSCGLLVYASSMDRSSINGVQEKLNDFIINQKISTFELSFYTNDRFGNVAGKQKGLLIDQKRFFLGDLPFDQVQKHLGDWKGPGKISFNKFDDIEARIWGFTDVFEGSSNDTNWSYPEKNDEIYLIIYQPLFRSKNPLYLLDSEKEAKPYWKGIDTTPQQLMGAMLNLAQVGPGQVILEPFAHTGSLILEATKLNLEGIIYNDIFETIGATDNLNFLTSSPELIISTSNEIEELIELKTKSKHAPSCNDIQEIARQSITWLPDKPYPNFTNIESLMVTHNCLTQTNYRLLFYMIRRFLIERRIGWLQNGSSEPDIVFGEYNTEGEYIKAIEESIKANLNLLKTFAENRKKIGKERKHRGIIDIGYEPISQNKCQTLVKDANIDITKGVPLADNSIDAIITDPPYGYGSAQEQDDILFLYKCFFKEMFRVLKPGGRITMCVLDKVRTGKEIKPEVMTAGVVGLANDIAKRNNVSFLVDSIRPFSRDSRFLSYWKAQYKLNRGILTFQISK
jgi:SAM-dependent methyltransferase